MKDVLVTSSRLCFVPMEVLSQFICLQFRVGHCNMETLFREKYLRSKFIVTA